MNLLCRETHGRSNCSGLQDKSKERKWNNFMHFGDTLKKDTERHTCCFAFRVKLFYLCNVAILSHNTSDEHQRYEAMNLLSCHSVTFFLQTREVYTNTGFSLFYVLHFEMLHTFYHGHAAGRRRQYLHRALQLCLCSICIIKICLSCWKMHDFPGKRCHLKGNICCSQNLNILQKKRKRSVTLMCLTAIRIFIVW